MRVVKACQNGPSGGLRALVGEMLNIEASVFFWLDGKQRDSWNDQPGYPMICDGRKQCFVRAASAVVIVPEAIWNTSLKAIQAMLKSMEGEMNATLKAAGLPEVLGRYHAISAAPHVSVQAKSSLTLTEMGAGALRNNVKRSFGGANARFTWDTKDLMHICDDTRQTFTIGQCAIFWDVDDVCVHAHNTVVNELTFRDMRGYANITEHTIRMAPSIPVDMIALSSHWSTRPVTRPRALTREIWSVDYGDLQLQPVSCGASAESTDVCSRCRSILHGDNYVIVVIEEKMRNIVANQPQSGISAVAMCPICVHTASDCADIERQCDFILRVTFPKPSSDLLALLPADSRDVIAQAARTEVISLNTPYGYVLTITLIGDKYAHISRSDTIEIRSRRPASVSASTRAYICTNLVHHPSLAGRKLCLINDR